MAEIDDLEEVVIPKMFDPEQVASIAQETLNGVRTEIRYSNENKVVWIKLCTSPQVELEIIATADQTCREGRTYEIEIWRNGIGLLQPRYFAKHENLRQVLRTCVSELMGEALSLAHACLNALHPVK